VREQIIRRAQAVRFFKWALEAWPYVFIVVSVVGLVYVGLNTAR
jgi:hypothetical protein